MRRGEYHDSVTLMVAGRAVAAVPGVARALVAMGTELNVSLLETLGYAPPDAGPGDLIIAFSCPDPGTESAALAALAASLSPAGSITAHGHPSPDQPLPRTTGTALGRTSAPLTLISTPGLAAVPDAMESLQYGASVVIFSDNVPLHHEIRLKEEAGRRNLLVMGPDCGTVVLHGTGLGFTNATRPGPISLVAASGTGAQHLMSLLHTAGTGIRHCLGVGGRDLTQAVAGRSTHAALDALAEDDETELIAVVSKPPHPAVAQSIEDHARRLKKPVLFAFIGDDHPTLTETAERILTTLGHPSPTPWPHWPPTDRTRAAPDSRNRGRTIRGLFSGGTLCAEAEVVLTRMRARLLEERLPGERLLEERSLEERLLEGRLPQERLLEERLPQERSGGRGEGESRELHIAQPTPTGPHSAAPFAPFPFTSDLTDFGDDAYTQGRPHPMIDNTLRLRAIAEAAEDARVGVLLLDVVLGRVAHADPAGELVPALGAARARGAAIVISLCGTDGDAQGLERQARAIADAGAWVYLSNAEAAAAAGRLAQR